MFKKKTTTTTSKQTILVLKGTLTMIYTVFEKNIKIYKINRVCVDNACIVLVMICFDNIIVMSRFVELCHGIIENQ